MARRWFLLVLLAIPAVVFAQQPRASETIDVTIRNVELVVTDRAGNRVAGLSPSEFTLFEDGTAHDITNFSEMRRGGGAATFQPAPRAILLAFDITSLTQPGRRHAVDSARQFLATNLRPLDRVTIFSLGSALTRASDWTSDPAVIAKALDDVSASASASLAGQREVTQRRIFEQIRDAQVGNSNVVFDFRKLVGDARIFAQAETRDASTTIAHLAAALNVFTPSAAKKVVVIAGRGLPMHPGADLFEILEMVRSRAEQGLLGEKSKGGTRQASPIAEEARFNMEPTLRAFASAAAKRGIAVYALDPELGKSGSMQVEQTAVSDVGSDFAGVASRVAGYQYLASLTGGSAILGRGDADALSDVAKDLDAYYSLGYHTDAKAGDVPRIEVKSKTGYRVRATFAGVPPSRLSEIEDLVVANHVSSLAGNDLGIALTADPAPVPGDQRRHVKLKILIPIRNLTLNSDGDFVTGGFDVYVATGDPNGNSSAVNHQGHQIRWPVAAVPELLAKTMTYAVDVVIEKGRKQISVGVIDQKSEKAGYAKVSV